MTQNTNIDEVVLKSDLFGHVVRVTRDGETSIRRDIRTAPLWTRGIARWLMRREARVLGAISGIDGLPRLLHSDRDSLERSFLDGQPMQVARPYEAEAYFRDARRLLRRLHRAGVVHNDLAKEPNILVTPDGHAAFIDFQLARHFAKRTGLFRLLAREDVRHLLKHKRYYCAEALTTRELSILQRPSLPSRIYMRTIKPIYLFVTRRLLGWSDREGAGDRGAVR
ncbi:MAG: RIO1 family regulatory kinase/ATPase [Pseudomonadota bacterium]